MAFFREITDLIVYIAVVGASILIFVVASEVWAIVFAGVLILGLGISVVVKTPGLLAGMKYPKLVSYLSKYAIVREDQMRGKLRWTDEHLHRALFELSKGGQSGPFVVFVKRQYLYVSPQIITQIQELLEKTADTGTLSRAVVKTLGDRFPFKTRLEIDAVLDRLRSVPQ